MFEKNLFNVMKEQSKYIIPEEEDSILEIEKDASKNRSSNSSLPRGAATDSNSPIMQFRFSHNVSPQNKKKSKAFFKINLPLKDS